MLEAVSEDIEARAAKLQSFNELHFVWMVSFFTGYQRLRNIHRQNSRSSVGRGDQASSRDPLLAETLKSTIEAEEHDTANVEDRDTDMEREPVTATTEPESRRQERRSEQLNSESRIFLGPVAAGIEFEVFLSVARRVSEYVQDKQWEKAEIGLRAVKEMVRFPCKLDSSERSLIVK